MCNLKSEMTKKDRKLLFLFNPQAGKGAIKEHLLGIITTFSDAGFEVTVQTTRYTGHLPQLICDKVPVYDLLVTSGGDGTLNETVNGLLQNGYQIPFGYIPAGTINDFATTLKLSKNMLQAAKDIVSSDAQGSVFPCDVGVFQDKYFSYVAAFGAFTDVSYQTPQSSKNLLGKAAYVLEAISRVPTLKAYRMRFEFDGQVIEDEFLYGMVSNSVSVGGMPLNKKRAVSMNDGLLEVLLIKKVALPVDLEAAINSLQKLEVAGADPDLPEVDSPFFYAFKVKNLRVLTLGEERVPWTLDGEYGGDDRDITIGVAPQALNILVPFEKKEPSN